MQEKEAGNQNSPSKFENLRLQAEALIKQQPDFAPEPPSDILELIHELRIHQAELEVQNEELKRVQEENFELQQDYQDLYEFAPCGYMTLNNKGVITLANLTAVGLLGVERNILSYSVFSSFIVSGWVDAYQDARAKAGESGKNQVVELPLKRVNGPPQWVRVDIDANRDETGAAIQWRMVLVDISEQKIAIDTVRESEERYRRLVESSPDMVYIYSAQKGATYWSSRVSDILGYSQEDLFADPFLWHDAIHPDDVPTVDKAIEAVGRNKLFDLEYRIRDAGGNWHWLKDRLIGKRKDGNDIIFEGVAVDITERRLLEDELHLKTHNLEERVKELNCLYEISYLRDQPDISMAEIFQRITDLIPESWQYPEVTCSRIRVGDKVYISKKFEESQWVISENIKMEEDKFGTVEVFYREETPSNGEGPFLKEERKLLKVIAERLGKYIEHAAVKTELHRMNDRLELRVKERTAELNENKVLLQKVFDGFPDPLFLLDKNMRIKILNKAASIYYKAEKDDVINRFCHQAFKENSRPCDGCQVPSAIEGRLNISFERLGLNDKTRLEQVTVYQIDQKHARFGGAILRIHDITESKLVKRQAIHNEKLASLGLMVSSIAHEIANPVSAVTFNAPILIDYIDAMISIVDEYAEKVQDFELFEMPYSFFRKDAVNIVNNILHASKRIESIVSDLRRIYGSRKKREKRWIDLKAVVDDLNAVILVEINHPIQFFEVNIPENLPKLYTDSDAIEQILTNLLINAMHASDKKNPRVILDVTTGKTWQDYLIIEIRDNGCGMDEETLPKIFKPFFSTRPPGMGTGLGLYVCQDLIQGLDGRIEVQSEVNKGSVFRVILPDFNRRSVKRFE